jgi:hypothetical protein
VSEDRQQTQLQLPDWLSELRRKLVAAGFEVVDRLDSQHRSSRRSLQMNRGDVSVRLSFDETLGWVVELAAARWGGGWVEAEVVCRAERRPCAQPTEVLNAVESAVANGFVRLPVSTVDANAVLADVSARLLRERLGF